MIMAIIKGFSKGLIVAIFSLLAFIIGLAAALKLSAAVANYLQTNMHVESKWLPILAFAIVFIGVVLLVRWGAVIIKKTVSLMLLGWLDTLGGILLFLVLYLMIYSVILFYATQVHLVTPTMAAESKTYEFVVPWGPRVINGFGKFIPLFSNMFTDLKDFFGNISKRP
jgi:membrane protein required for colicin V production